MLPALAYREQRRHQPGRNHHPSSSVRTIRTRRGVLCLERANNNNILVLVDLHVPWQSRVAMFSHFFSFPVSMSQLEVVGSRPLPSGRRSRRSRFYSASPTCRSLSIPRNSPSTQQHLQADYLCTSFRQTRGSAIQILDKGKLTQTIIKFLVV